MKLKPCPFCGGEAYRRKTHHEQMNGCTPEKYVTFHVTCKDCGADLRSPESTPDYCVELWNNRPEPQPLTMEQLGQMDGQPAYIEDVERYCVIDFDEQRKRPYAVFTASSATFHWDIEKRGLTLYTHKPEVTEEN